LRLLNGDHDVFGDGSVVCLPSMGTRRDMLPGIERQPHKKLVPMAWGSISPICTNGFGPAGRFLAALAEHEIAERSRPHGSRWYGAGGEGVAPSSLERSDGARQCRNPMI
jgi:hypothetical protein